MPGRARVARIILLLLFFIIPLVYVLCHFFFRFSYVQQLYGFEYIIVQQYLGRALRMGGSVGGFVVDSWVGV